MRIDVHHFIHFDTQNLGEIPAQLARIEVALAGLQTQGNQIMADLTSITAEVARNTEVDQSAITLITGLAAQIEALKADPVALQALVDSMRGSSDALAAAVLANTPAAPPV